MFGVAAGLVVALALGGQLPSAEEIAKLPPDGGPEFNRLVFEKSPYLLQHARNPVDWYPWGAAAFERARKEEKPIFLSIGYSTCHWCHVMAHESFEDAGVAKLLNASFVCIKVDREERPDVDQVYMAVVQAMTGAGGWPMTVVMTPDQKPFFAGTYFQKDSAQGRPGLTEILPQLADAWKTKRKDVTEHADRVAAWVVSAQAAAPGDFSAPALLERATGELASRFDSAEGGFDIAPKFPIPHQLGFLLRRWKATGDAHALEMVERTLAAMARGGIHDQLGGGFHRYSTDRRWRVPHFEKMLYDQALIAEVCVEAFEATRKPAYRDLARDVLAYVLRDLGTPDGAFFSSEDADSEGEEGKFYVWSREQVSAALGAKDGALFADVYGVSALEKSVLHVADPERAAGPEMRAARAKLLAVRGARVQPSRDEKVLTDWNGLMIGAFAHAARAFDEPSYADAARRAAGFVLAKASDANGRLWKRWARGEAAHAAVLDDYAFLCQGLIELYETDFDPRWLAEAARLAREMTARFWDEKSGGFFFTASDGETLIARGKESYDGAVPSGNSVAALDLLRLGHLTGDTALLERADKLFRAFADGLGKAPSNHAQMLIALDFAAGPASEIVIAGADARAMLSAIRARFLPNTVVLLRPDGDEPAIAKLAPFVRETKSVGGRTTAYVCRGFACQAPVTDVAALEALLR